MIEFIKNLFTKKEHIPTQLEVKLEEIIPTLEWYIDYDNIYSYNTERYIKARWNEYMIEVFENQSIIHICLINPIYLGNKFPHIKHCNMDIIESMKNKKLTKLAYLTFLKNVVDRMQENKQTKISRYKEFEEKLLNHI